MSTGSLDTVAAKALQLWTATDSNAVAGRMGAVGFHPSEPMYGPLMPPEIAMPDRLIPEQETPDDRRDN